MPNFWILENRRSYTSDTCMSRIVKEYKVILKTLASDDPIANPYRGIIESLNPIDETDLSKWEAIISGPSDTPYENHQFRILIEVPSSYPMNPPKISFMQNNILHCNVKSATGEICLNILKPEEWTPVWDLLHCVHAVWRLLREPVCDSPFDVDIGNIIRCGDMSAYQGIVKYFLAERERINNH
ncbi:AIC_G0021200.mRNA.1.CDS.1 [Saccharomyces cerevisiae]|uniref:Ubiquitin-conjugating enzyme E2-21 kDa n=1 Tax=Saccharomyces cerevisiae (strain Lalvin EC1118 / Prise de mousse) TaxID=643680 RepID=C8Z926_YEAS8|nr:Pex4p [Saccharomyces cerevisiae YJM270]CAI4478904.1 CAS_1a_G0021180.mRNA.1.CDS.1 [Saccharomyces cerevisiae]CAY79892.1 Pex4p [Saccharomyces cerevisiae EC1118]CAI4482335.1 AIC_G0021200.mRNA.1.CDS.1 [Saccharomyces cerevisiae]CAI4489610.1 AFI_G0021110.mRNA.1.CDS.1 [Saccharomyces cerevisiae]